MLRLLMEFAYEDTQKLATLVRKFVPGRGVVDEEGSISSISYIIDEDAGKAAFLVPHKRILKRRFESRVRENIPLEWGAVVCAASHIRDFSVEKYGYEVGETRTRQLRAEWLEGCFLWSLRSLHEEEGIAWNWPLSAFQVGMCEGGGDAAGVKVSQEVGRSLPVQEDEVCIFPAQVN